MFTKVYFNYSKLRERLLFTRHSPSLDDTHNSDTPFGRAHIKINSVLNRITPYSAQATLNPNETCEFPDEMDDVGGKCLIFDRYGTEQGKAPFGVLLLIEVFRSEMDYVREHCGRNLFEKLKEAGHYPYSDMEREPVV